VQLNATVNLNRLESGECTANPRTLGSHEKKRGPIGSSCGGSTGAAEHCPPRRACIGISQEARLRLGVVLREAGCFPRASVHTRPPLVAFSGRSRAATS